MSTTLRLDADQAGIAQAVALLDQGSLVAVPSETVYGLAADAANAEAITALYAAKARPARNPLICHIADLTWADDLAILNDEARVLARRFWPGPLTLVVPLKPGAPLAPAITAGGTTVGLRLPRHDLFQAVLRGLGRALAAPSANPSGRLSPTSADHVLAGLSGRIAAVLDGGPCPIGVESSVIDLSQGPAKLLRPGGLSRAELEAALGYPLADLVPGDGASVLASPGLLASHYAPRAKLRLNAIDARPGEIYLAFGPNAPPGAAANLSPTGDLAEAAAKFFATLAALDALDPAVIAVAPIPMEGLGEALNDRLRRAAAPRP